MSALDIYTQKKKRKSEEAAHFNPPQRIVLRRMAANATRPIIEFPPVFAPMLEATPGWTNPGPQVKSTTCAACA